jgi:hypothetical protein
VQSLLNCFNTGDNSEDLERELAGGGAAADKPDVDDDDEAPAASTDGKTESTPAVLLRSKSSKARLTLTRPH